MAVKHRDVRYRIFAVTVSRPPSDFAFQCSPLGSVPCPNSNASGLCALRDHVCTSRTWHIDHRCPTGPMCFPPDVKRPIYNPITISFMSCAAPCPTSTTSPPRPPPLLSSRPSHARNARWTSRLRRRHRCRRPQEQLCWHLDGWLRRLRWYPLWLRYRYYLWYHRYERLAPAVRSPRPSGCQSSIWPGHHHLQRVTHRVHSLRWNILRYAPTAPTQWHTPYLFLQVL